MMFPGQGTEHVHMTHGIYQQLPTYQQHLDTVLQLFDGHGIGDLSAQLFGSDTDQTGPTSTVQSQCLLFAVEWALAQLYLELGVRPRFVVGHSVGELVAATLASVFTLQDAVQIIVARGRAMHQAAAGAMAAVPLSPDQAVSKIQCSGVADRVWVAAHNAPQSTVVSGYVEGIEKLVDQLASEGIAAQRLKTKHAFHTPMMKEATNQFAAVLSAVQLSAPRIPLASTVTGRMISDREATDAAYWCNQLLQPVVFSPAVSCLLKLGCNVLLQVGPGTALVSLVKQQLSHLEKQAVATSPPVLTIASARHPTRAIADCGAGDYHAFLAALGQLWQCGLSTIKWELLQHPACRSISLPGYPFQRKYIKPAPGQSDMLSHSPRECSLAPCAAPSDVASWMFYPTFELLPPRCVPAVPKTTQRLVVLCCGRAQRKLAAATATALVLRDPSCRVATIVLGDGFAFDGLNGTVRPGSMRADFSSLLALLYKMSVSHVCFGVLWQPADFKSAGREAVCHSVVALAQALPVEQLRVGITLQVTVFSGGIYRVNGDEPLIPANAVVLGAVLAVPQELPELRCQLRELESLEDAALIADELRRPYCADEKIVARRHRQRWVPTHRPLAPKPGAAALMAERGRQRLLGEVGGCGGGGGGGGGALVLTGGLGRIGLALTRMIAELSPSTQLVLLTRRADFPAPEAWPAILSGSCASMPSPSVVDRVSVLRQVGSERVEVRGGGQEFQSAEAFAEMLGDVGSRHGRVHGVLHLAGLAALQYVGQTTSASLRDELDPKLNGAELICDALALESSPSVGFVALFSSLAGVLGGYGMTGYAGANAAMDVLAMREFCEDVESEAHAPCGTKTRWISVCWDDWDFDYGKEQTAAYERSAAKHFAMSAARGFEALQLCLGTTLPSLSVSTRPLLPRFERWVRSDGMASAGAAGGRAAASSSRDTAAHGSGGNRATNRRRGKLQADRHNAAIVSEQPDAAQLGTQVLHVFRRVLGEEEMAATDDFFDRGGDSMLLSQLLMMLRRELPPSLVQPCTIGWLMETPSPVAVTTRLLDAR
jgi:phthiocerol/phenolphthiocerol synthesis type-I polyketide synthase E